MKIEFVSRRDFNFLKELALLLDCPFENDHLLLPTYFGDGFIKKIDLEPGLKLTMHRHSLKEELVVKRKSSPEKNGMVTITFNTVDRPLVYLQDNPGASPIKLSSIYITSTDIGLETRIPVNKNIHSTIIIINASILLNLLESHTDNDLIKNVTSGSESFWYDTEMTPKIQELLFQLDEPKNHEQLTHLFYRIKIQQLIYELFVGILEKENRPFQSIKAADIEKMYFIRETLISNLNSPPTLAKLARIVYMSETKMNLLFRQIFGKSVYNYYQKARMEEAARLLKDLSVSETSYRLGFDSPSYFSQLFEKHFKVRPKKFRNGFLSK